MTVTANHFDEFFRELWGFGPYSWQRRLAARVCAGDWPRFIDLPTASGKTACLDIAVFAMAVQATLDPGERTVGRRVFFVVNRRVIVDEAHERARQIAVKLVEAASGTILQAVAEALKRVSGETSDEVPPLDVAMLRGGIVRDNRWMRSITQPTIITSTIDQVGSRLLFRGYGVTPEAAPLHAALIAHDSTILLDEAHISQPFVETLNNVQRFRSTDWAEQPIRTPFHFVQMTATPGNVAAANVFRLDEDDRRVLHDRHGKPKWIHLHSATNAKGKGAKPIAALADVIAAKAVELYDEDHRNIAIVVNRIATARKVHELLPALLRKAKIADFDLHLAIGRMRPLDRDELTKSIQDRVGKSRNESEPAGRPMFVVATQCLEVGADFDFDAMVTECASLDALRQRFGRLNRSGRPVEGRGCIVIRGDQIKTDEQLASLDSKDEVDDPIYGNALARTWNWLQFHALDGKVDFGVNAMNDMLGDVDVSSMLGPRLNAPVMFPAYVDMWAQTNPFPVPSPDVALFLHGPQRGEPDVNVCWREDLRPDNRDDWPAIVSLCPPSSPECMPVPIGVFKKWLTSEDDPKGLDIERSDLLDGQIPDDDENVRGTPQAALVWRGVERSFTVKSRKNATEIKPGETIVLPMSAGGWEVFGHLPDLDRADVAEKAYRQSRGRVILRLWPGRFNEWLEDDALQSFREWLGDAELPIRRAELRLALQRLAELVHGEERVIAESLSALADPKLRMKDERYPGGKGVVLETRARVVTTSGIPAMDDGEDETSRTFKSQPASLVKHLNEVREEADVTLRGTATIANADSVRIAAELHDLGKADERFQALLINGDRTDAALQTMLWAKSARRPQSKSARHAALIRSGLPNGFRHEMLSVQLAEMLFDKLPRDSNERDLVLHLIAAHHGHARPFAPVVIDPAPPEVCLSSLGMPDLCADDRRRHPPHRIDSGIAERFWSLTRCFGWWGLAYLEAILRLSDQRASAREESEAAEDAGVETTETE